MISRHNVTLLLCIRLRRDNKCTNISKLTPFCSFKNHYDALLSYSSEKNLVISMKTAKSKRMANASYPVQYDEYNYHDASLVRLVEGTDRS